MQSPPPLWENVIFKTGCPPILGEVYLYFNDRKLAERIKMLVPQLDENAACEI